MNLNDGLFYGYIIFNFITFLIIFIIFYHFENKNENESPIKPIRYRKFSKYFYQITINGGLQSSLSDDISIYVKLIGKNNDSQVHCLKKATSCSEPKRKHVFFKNGETKSFIINEPNSLGDVEALKFWFSLNTSTCDNDLIKQLSDTKLRKWYLNYVTVFDVLGQKSYNFLFYNWILVDIEHRLTSFVSMLANNSDMNNFGHNFITHIIDLTFNDNIFLSLILSKRPYSHVPKFTKLLLIIVLNFINMLLIGSNFQFNQTLILWEILMNLMAFFIYNVLFKKFYFLKWYYKIEEKCEKCSLNNYLKESCSTSKLTCCNEILKELKNEFDFFNKFQNFYNRNMFDKDLEPIKSETSAILVCIYHFL
jgi:hypothetical protein